MYLADLILLVVVVVFFGRKIYQKQKKEKVEILPAEHEDVKRTLECSVVIEKYNIKTMNNDEIENEMSERITRILKVTDKPEVSFRVSGEYMYMFIRYQMEV